jgi:hypothetical protein
MSAAKPARATVTVRCLDCGEWWSDAPKGERYTSNPERDGQAHAVEHRHLIVINTFGQRYFDGAKEEARE